MEKIEKVIADRIVQLKQIIHDKEKALINVPTGTVQVFRSERRTQFYYNNNGKRRYIKEDEKSLVPLLCQKDYDMKILAAAKKELKDLEKANKNYHGKSCEDIYEKLSKVRKDYITPIWIPDDEYVNYWEQVEYEKKVFAEESTEFYTNKGERVRSKTEILIANALHKHQIPYRYEYPVKLKQFGVVHPDFTVLNVRLRKEIFWEHMGMLDNDNYLEHALNKITAYEKNRIFPGDRLILTHETSKCPIQSKIIEKTIEQYLK